jgi:8-amino-7-oxononanoate synthase
MSLHMESPSGARTIISGREMDYFAGTGYLGLQNHPKVLQAAQDTLRVYGLSTATSRGGYGEHPIYDQLERNACRYFDAEKVLYFASGYMGMAVLTQCTLNRFDHIFIDSLAHYSLWDAAYATNLPITPFQHLQVQSLVDHFHTDLRPRERPLVLSDGVFPISGEIAPLPEYLEHIKARQGWVYLDDAHSVGVLGANGRGTAEYYGIQDDSCFASGTLAKALGGFGGILWGRTRWVETLARKSSICEGSSPPPLVVAAASAEALSIAGETPVLRSRLWENVTYARKGLRGLGWDLPESPVPILCLGSLPGVDLVRIKKDLLKQDIAIELVRSYPSTPAGGAIRIAIFATHSICQIDRLIESIKASM